MDVPPRFDLPRASWPVDLVGSDAILTIVGPTASGKTAWGLRLARELDGEIISADSRQVYRFLSVGTAKPRGAWQSLGATQAYVVDGIVMHLVDFLEPDQKFSAAEFAQRAAALIDDIRDRGKTPILVGGTGFYLSALESGLAPLPTANELLRGELRQIAQERGRAFLHQELSRVDPELAAKIPANNIQRVIRAIEVYRLTGTPLSEWHRRPRQPVTSRRYSLEYWGIEIDRPALERRIAERCRAMVDGGMIEETEALLKRGAAPSSPALTGLGYPRILSFLRGEIGREKLLALLITDTRRYAKRQMTWFRHQAKVTWKEL